MSYSQTDTSPRTLQSTGLQRTRRDSQGGPRRRDHLRCCQIDPTAVSEWPLTDTCLILDRERLWQYFFRLYAIDFIAVNLNDYVLAAANRLVSALARTIELLRNNVIMNKGVNATPLGTYLRTERKRQFRLWYSGREG